MKVQYKQEIHRRKGKKNDTHLRFSWKDNPKDDWGSRHEIYCCDEMKQAVSHGFITVESTKTNFIGIKWNEKEERLKVPLVCLSTMNENGGDFNDDCPHEEEVLPIKHCPFCTAEITTECLEKKRITHTCKKVQKTYEECEDKVEEEIL